MAERFIATVLKTVEGSRLPGVQIPPPPPNIFSYTSEVGSAISAIQKSTEKSIRQVDVSVEGVNAATELAGRSGEALQEIVRLAEGAADQVRAIAAASEQQSATSEEINRSIADINEVAGRNAAAMDQAAQSVQAMADEARKLNALIEKMKNA